MKSGPFNSDDVKIEKYTEFIKICYRSMAMLPLFENPNNRLHSFLNSFYTFWIYFTSIHIFAFSSIDLISNWDGNLFEATYNLINTIIYATNTVLLFYFHLYQDYFINLLDKLDLTFRFTSAKGLTQLNMGACFHRARNFSRFFTYACLIGALNWVIEPLFRKGRNLPLKIWYPVDVTLSPYYEIAFLSQLFGQIMVALVFSNLAIFYLSGCVLICGQFDLLCCSLRNLIYTAMLAANHPINSIITLCGYDYEGSNKCPLPEDEYRVYFCGDAKIFDPLLEKSFKNQLTKFDLNNISAIKAKLNKSVHDKRVICDNIMTSIKDSIQHHQEILEYCADFESFCSPVMLFKMFQITLLACFIMYASSVIPVFEYFTLTIADLFMLCYCGNEVMSRSVNVSSALCCGPWHLLGKKHLKTLLPLMIRSARPVKLTGGKFYTLTLENYITVLKVSFSYFTVLRNMNETHNK